MCLLPTCLYARPPSPTRGAALASTPGNLRKSTTGLSDSSQPTLQRRKQGQRGEASCPRLWLVRVPPTGFPLRSAQFQSFLPRVPRFSCRSKQSLECSSTQGGASSSHSLVLIRQAPFEPEVQSGKMPNCLEKGRGEVRACQDENVPCCVTRSKENVLPSFVFTKATQEESSLRRHCIL